MSLFYSHFQAKVLPGKVNVLLNLNFFGLELAKMQNAGADFYEFAGFALKTN